MEIEIPSGLTHCWTIGKVVIEAAFVIGLLIAIPWILFSTLWSLLPVIPCWGFLAYHSQREPLFLRFWAGQLSCQPYYHG
jgi:hypothetical protein